MRLHIIIPARRGSKGIIKKNIKKIKGKTLVEISINFALKLKINGNIIVSSDMREVKDICSKYKNNVIFDRRPKILAKDDSSTIEVVTDLYNRMDEIDKNDIILLLEPTSPIREIKTIKSALETFKNKNLDSMVSVVKQNNLMVTSLRGYLKNSFHLNTLQRQKRASLFEIVGVFYINKVLTCMQKGFLHNKTYLYEVPKEEGIDINELSDLALARKILC